jgi:hypothetical protein
MTIRRREPRNVAECENPDCTGCAYCDAMGWTRRPRKNPMAKKRKKKVAKKRLSRPSPRRAQKRRTPKIQVRFAAPAVALFSREYPEQLVTALKHHLRGITPAPGGMRSAIVGFYRIKGTMLSFTTEVGKRVTTIAFA